MTFRGGGSGKPLGGQEVPRSAYRFLVGNYHRRNRGASTRRTAQRNIITYAIL